MRILYGVCGEGFGHSSRAKEVIKYLQKKGHEVKIITYGQAYPILKEANFDVVKVKGLHIVFGKGKINVKETIKSGFLSMANNVGKIKQLKQVMEEFKPDVCISDMEPIVPVLSFWHRLPLISLDNQHRITNLVLNVPKRYYKDYLIAKMFINRVISSAEWYIVTSFSKANMIRKKTIVVPPILRKEIVEMKDKVKFGNYILVYLTKPDKKVINVLKNFKEKFIVYGFDRESSEGNIRYKKNGKWFINDLGDCKAIIATAGFTLMSEAIFLGKPYFALPLVGQFEQVLNALFLKQAGYGDYADDNKGLEEKLGDFLKSSEFYKKMLKEYKPEEGKIFKALDDIMAWVQKSNKKK